MDLYEQTARMIIRTQGLKKGMRWANTEIKNLTKIGNDEGAEGWKVVKEYLEYYQAENEKKLKEQEEG